MRLMVEPAEKQEKVDVVGMMGQSNRPPSPVDKNNFPNTGSMGK
jgi:hypothetical protein